MPCERARLGRKRPTEWTGGSCAGMFTCGRPRMGGRSERDNAARHALVAGPRTTSRTKRDRSHPAGTGLPLPPPSAQCPPEVEGRGGIDSVPGPPVGQDTLENAHPFETRGPDEPRDAGTPQTRGPDESRDAGTPQARGLRRSPPPLILSPAARPAGRPAAHTWRPDGTARRLRRWISGKRQPLPPGNTPAATPLAETPPTGARTSSAPVWGTILWAGDPGLVSHQGTARGSRCAGEDRGAPPSCVKRF